MNRTTLVSILLTALATLTACDSGKPEQATSVEKHEATDRPPTQQPIFADIAAESGIDFIHWNGMVDQRFFVEPVGSGAALIDVDNDGDLDVYLVQSTALTPEAETFVHSASADNPIGPPAKPGGRLYRNDLSVDENGKTTMRFTDITEESGLSAMEYGMGVATGDIDNDGRIDIYLSNFGPNQLWHNLSENGRIRFEEITAQAGVDDQRWSTSASFADINHDGWLDLFVANYVDFRVKNHRLCRSPGGRQDYCGPQSYNGETDRLFLNLGDGTFRDITGPAGLLDSPSSGLGVVAADFDQDGWIDLYVANDQRRNFLWHNLGSGDDGIPRFENTALMSGVAVSMDGRAQASMGVVAGDIDNDGDDDLFMTHLSSDTNTLYINDGHGFFDDRSAMAGLGAPSLATTGFGTALIDIENNGSHDLVVANGAVRVIEEQARANDPYPLKQPNHLYINQGNGDFKDISEQVGAAFTAMEVSRGVAVGDVDNDGKADFLLSNNNGPARLFHNRHPASQNWIGLRLLLPNGRDALGAHVIVTKSDGSRLHRRIATDGSYLSASDPRLLVGLGNADGVSRIEVKWLSGDIEVWEGLPIGRYHTLIQGQGSAGGTE